MGTVVYLQVPCPHLDIKKLVYGAMKTSGCLGGTVTQCCGHRHLFLIQNATERTWTTTAFRLNDLCIIIIDELVR